MRLRDVREDADVTQATIAAHLHIKPNTYSQYETGKRQIPVETLAKVAVFFGVSADYLLELTDDRRPYPTSKAKKR